MTKNSQFGVFLTLRGGFYTPIMLFVGVIAMPIMVPAYRMGYHCPIELLMLEHWLHSSPITHQGVLSNSLLPLLKSLPDLRSVRSCSNRFTLIRLNRPRDLILSWMLFFTCLIHRNGFAPGYS